MDLEGAYRLYAGRLFTYAKGILGDHHSAADVVQDAFVLASQRAGQLRDPAALSSWLYTITRRESLRHLKKRARLFPVETVEEQADPGTDPLAAVRDAEIGELVWAAFGGLVANDREIIELSVRHGLSAVDISSVLRISVKHANARISRARASMTQALGVLLVARSSGDCPQLAEMLGNWNGELTVLLRKRLHRHIEGCRVCAEEKQRRMDPAAILSGYAALPFLVLLPPLHTGHAGLSGESGLPSQTGHPGERGDSGEGVWPSESGRRSAAGNRGQRGEGERGRRGKVRKVAVGVAVVVAILVGTSVALARGGRGEPETLPTAVTSVGPQGTGEAPGQGTQPAARPSGQGSPDGSKSPAAPGFQATGQVTFSECPGGSHYTLIIRVTTNGPLTQAILLWQIGNGPVYWDDMSLTPSKMEGTGTAGGNSLLPIKWWVKASGANGSTAHSATVTSPNPCAS